MMNPDLNKLAKERYTWHNATNNVRVTPLRFFYPTDEFDIAEIVKDAEQQSLKVRAVGSGHSFSEVAVCKDYLLSMKKMDSVEKTDAGLLKEACKHKHLVTLGAGTILMELNKKLDKMGLALPNMGAVDFQTVSGALLTGTHGTGINQPAFPDMVRSIHMVGTGGKMYQIEPDDGITDPVRHTDKHGDSIELIQDDRDFYSAVLGFGGMGIVYKVTMEVKPAFWMKESREIVKWSALREQLLSGEFMDMVEHTDFVAFRVNPYEVKGDHTCALVKQHIIPEDEQPRGWGARRRNILSTFFGDIEYLIESTIRRINRNPKKVRNSIEQALKFTRDREFTGKSFKVLFQSGISVVRHGISSEFAFEARAEKIVEVLERIFVLAKRNAENGNLYQASHIPVRFVQPSRAYLSSAYNRKTVYIDVPLLHKTVGDFEILERYQEMMIELDGIPHWGKVNNKLYERNDFIKSKFCRHAAWTERRNLLDPKGTFLNDFIIKMGLA
ncbi:MAG: FAD-binding protein [Cytophagales bacterium]|nr:FAD-binding protein [Cytophagales bacterium]